MRRRFLFIAIALGIALSLVSPIFVNGPVRSAEDQDTTNKTRIKAGEVTYILPFAAPSGEEIRRKLPAEARAKNGTLHCELLEYRVNDRRFFPLVGPARLVEVRFKCTLTAAGQDYVVHLDRDHLIQVD
jgi:hypothetical protein